MFVNNKTRWSISLWNRCGLILLLSTGISHVAKGEEQVDFVKSVKPIFEQHCLKCHGEEKPKNFRIDVKDEAMGYIAENSADDSDLYLSLVTDDEDMLMPPPKANLPLTEQEIQTIKAWIDQGAEWPEGVVFVATNSAPQTTSDPPTKAVESESVKSADSVAPVDQPVDQPVDPKTELFFDAVGSLHPAAIHLPIGLLLGAGLFALFSLRGNFVMSDCAYYCLWLGTLGAVAACISGWWASPMADKGTVVVTDDLWDMKQPVFWHRTSALVVTAVAFLLGLFAASARSRDPDDGIVWKLGVILLAAAIGFVGHEGGELTHGKHHYDALHDLGAELFPGFLGEPPQPAPADVQPEQSPPADDDQVGKTSEET